MKKIIYCLFFSMLAFSCKENGNDTGPSSEIDITPPGVVTDVVATPSYGEVLIEWTRPIDEDYGYTSVEFVRDGKDIVVQGRDRVTIMDFTDTEEYEFSLYAVDKKQNRAAAVTVTAAPKEAPCILVDPTIMVEPDMSAANISWSNVTEKVVLISVGYTDVNGDAQTVERISKRPKDNISIPLEPNVTHALKVSVSSGSLKMPAKDFTVTPLLSIDKSTWTIAGFSSEEATGEGPDNGQAIRVLDGNEATFWHTKWSGSFKPTLPNYLIIDMQKNSLLWSVKVVQRNGGGASLNTVEILIGSDTDSFEKVGELTFPNSAGGSQETNLDPQIEGRYLKINMPDSRNATNHSMIAEIYARGIVLEN